MTCRLLSQNDFAEVQDLWDYCFEKKDSSFFKWYFQNSFQYERTLGTFNGEKLKSMLNLSPYRLQICGSEIPVSYIVGVATWPEYRGQGEAKRLLRDALVKMREWGEPLALLMPSRPEFYYPMDFQLYNNHLRCQIPMEELRKLTSPLALTARNTTINDIDVLNEIFQKTFKNYEGNIARNKKNWQSWIESTKAEGGNGYLFLENNQPVGYLFYILKEGVLTISDWGAVSQNARKGLISFLYQHRAQAQSIQLDIPTDDPWIYLLPELKERVSFIPFMSSRIVDAQKLVDSLQWPGEGRFVLEISDSILEWNHGTFLLELKNGKATLIQSSEKPAFKITIGGLAQWLFGQMNCESLERAGFLKVFDLGDTEKFDFFWRRKVTFINEYF